MSYLLFPGRHLINTTFQERYLKRLFSEPSSSWPGFLRGRATLPQPPAEIVFAITSANQENSRYNPIPFHIRAIGVDRFARHLQADIPFRYRILGIPHYGHTKNFAAFTIKEIADQTEQTIRLTPENCLVICSTPEVIQLYQDLGFAVAPAELAEKEKPPTPIEIIREIGERGADWCSGPLAAKHLAASHAGLFQDFAEVPKRIARLYQDPLTNQEGSLTDSRNYSSYARGMNEIIRLKYLDIRDAIRPGRIVDEGCADGALLAEVSRDFPDSDLFGIDLSAEFAGRFQERQRAGEFGGAYVHFFHRNLLDRIFEPESINTTICNSTLHELWSYAEQEKTVRAYLREKFRQLRPGGCLIFRDVVGPENPNQTVFLHCHDKDGDNVPVAKWESRKDRPRDELQQLSTQSRFLLFAHDFLALRVCPIKFQPAQRNGLTGFTLTLRAAAEFLSKKDYTDNWLSEMNEEFCFWSFSDWKRIFAEIGFRVIEDPNQPTKGSRVYTNSWIIQNRFEGHVQIIDDSGTAQPWPPTNMILVAEKPLV
jgi:SAM-dependent methyltransferase